RTLAAPERSRGARQRRRARARSRARARRRRRRRARGRARVVGARANRGTGGLGNMRSLEWWIARIRLLAIPFAILQVSLTEHYPSGDQTIAWVLTAALAFGAVGLFVAVRR